eukprot:8618699-Lingulodinium_polyedra.AAC.1
MGDPCFPEFPELRMEPEVMPGRFLKATEDVNAILATFYDELMGDNQVGSEQGTEAIGSGLHGWSFN